MCYLKFLILNIWAIYLANGYQFLTNDAVCPSTKCCKEIKVMLSNDIRQRGHQVSEVKDNLTTSLASHVSAMKYKLSALTRQSSESKQKLSSLTRQSSEAKDNLTSLSRHVSKMDENLTSLSRHVTKMDENITRLTRQVSEIKTILLNLDARLSGFEAKSIPRPSFTAKNCAELLKKGIDKDGVYDIIPDGKKKFSVRCDMTTDGGGWTIFQRRLDGSVDFYRGWNAYKYGFGQLEGEFWLGLDKIHQLTESRSDNVLRVDLEDFLNETKYAIYQNFAVASESNKYKLSLGTYSGNARDSLSWHKGQAFSTNDKDNDKTSSHCAVYYTGAWWYNACHFSNLNGFYYRGAGSPWGKGVVWFHWRGWKYSLKKTEMKIRPSDFLK